MNRPRTVVLVAVGVLLVGAVVLGQLTGNDGAADRLLASGATSTSSMVARGGPGAATTVAAGVGGGGTAAATTGPGSPTTTAPGVVSGGGAGPTTAGSAPTPSGPAGGRASGVGTGGVTGGIPESIEPGPTEPSPSGRGGSGGEGGGGGGGGGETTTTTAPAPGAQVHSLTQDDDGKTFAVKVNDIVLLRLEPVAGAFWSDPASDHAAVRREAVSVLDGAVTGSFAAVSVGTATLSATTGQTCTTANPPCLAAARQIRVTVTVTA